MFFSAWKDYEMLHGVVQGDLSSYRTQIAVSYNSPSKCIEQVQLLHDADPRILHQQEGYPLKNASAFMVQSSIVQCNPFFD